MALFAAPSASVDFGRVRQRSVDHYQTLAPFALYGFLLIAPGIRALPRMARAGPIWVSGIHAPIHATAVVRVN